MIRLRESKRDPGIEVYLYEDDTHIRLRVRNEASGSTATILRIGKISGRFEKVDGVAGAIGDQNKEWFQYNSDGGIEIPRFKF